VPRRAKSGHGGGAPQAGGSSGLTPRAIAVLLIILFIFLGWTFFWLLYAERQSLIGLREAGLADEISLALSVCQRIAEDSQARGLSVAEAQFQALETLRRLRYGPMHQGYFYVLSTSGELLAHPLRPDLEGTDAAHLTDERGSRFIGEIVRMAGAGVTGSTRYYWQWAGEPARPPARLAQFGTFLPWAWVIVSDVSIADIDEQIAHDLTMQVAVLVILVATLAFVLSVTLRRLVLSGVDRLTSLARRLQAGDLSARAVTGPMDELGPLATAINLMAEGIEQRDQQIRRAQRAAVFALAKLAEARDNETGGHLLRVREYSVALAEVLRGKPGFADQIDDQFVDDLYDATMLHDIGKVATPDRILLKPDVLDEGEMAVMMSHTLTGANTIRAARRQLNVESGFLVMAEQIARSHHERWDGTGYVERLAAGAIPLAARIFTIADVYDALTTARPYKLAFAHEQALATMQEDRGRRFDPGVYDAFIEVADTFDHIRREFAD